MRQNDLWTLRASWGFLLNWDWYWVFSSWITEMKESRSAKNWHPSYYSLTLNTCCMPDTAQTSVLCLCKAEVSRGCVVWVVWASLMIYSFVVMKASRVLTMSIHSAKHVTSSNSFNPHKNLVCDMLSLSHFIDEEIKAQKYQANCPWSHSDKWPNQGWMDWLRCQTSSHSSHWCSGPNKDADSISLGVLLQLKYKRTYMEHLRSSP